MTMSSFDKQLVVTGIVFAVFMVESLIHYSMAESKSERTTFMDAFKTLPDRTGVIHNGRNCDGSKHT